MKCFIMEKREVDAKFLKVSAEVRYWEDAIVNGIEDIAGDLIPCRDGNNWCPLIDIDTGEILNWKKGVTAKIYYKVCDCGIYSLLDNNESEIISIDGYVINELSIKKCGYGDYIILDILENGKIDKWTFDAQDFIDRQGEKIWKTKLLNMLKDYVSDKM